MGVVVGRDEGRGGVRWLGRDEGSGDRLSGISPVTSIVPNFVTMYNYYTKFSGV